MREYMQWSYASKTRRSWTATAERPLRLLSRPRLLKTQNGQPLWREPLVLHRDARRKCRIHDAEHFGRSVNPLYTSLILIFLAFYKSNKNN